MKKLLILTANPKNTDRLRLDEEVREIEEELARAKKRDQFEVISKWATRPQDLRHALIDYEPQFVHFSGHGAGEEGLVLEDELGKPKLVSSEALASLFELCTSHVECIVFNACYSREQADAVGQHIAVVIGMGKAIGDKAAIKFAGGFYGAIGAGHTIKVAYKFGCTAIQLEGITGNLIPILHFNPDVPPPESSEDPKSQENFDSNSRHQLYEILTRLIPQDLNMIIVILNPPPGLIPPSHSGQADRVDALIRWADSPTGCGLEKVQQALNNLLSR